MKWILFGGIALAGLFLFTGRSNAAVQSPKVEFPPALKSAIISMLSSKYPGARIAAVSVPVAGSNSYGMRFDVTETNNTTHVVIYNPDGTPI